jgi:hypothetical protein
LVVFKVVGPVGGAREFYFGNVLYDRVAEMVLYDRMAEMVVSGVLIFDKGK